MTDVEKEDPRIGDKHSTWLFLHIMVGQKQKVTNQLCTEILEGLLAYNEESARNSACSAGSSFAKSSSAHICN